jgi:hypothetical protein
MPPRPLWRLRWLHNPIYLLDQAIDMMLEIRAGIDREPVAVNETL